MKASMWNWPFACWTSILMSLPKALRKIQKGLDLKDDQLREVISQIIRLNPKPGVMWKGTTRGELHYTRLFYCQ